MDMYQPPRRSCLLIDRQVVAFGAAKSLLVIIASHCSVSLAPPHPIKLWRINYSRLLSHISSMPKFASIPTMNIICSFDREFLTDNWQPCCWNDETIRWHACYNMTVNEGRRDRKTDFIFFFSINVNVSQTKNGQCSIAHERLDIGSVQCIFVNGFTLFSVQRFGTVSSRPLHKSTQLTIIARGVPLHLIEWNKLRSTGDEHWLVSNSINEPYFIN